MLEIEGSELVRFMTLKIGKGYKEEMKTAKSSLIFIQYHIKMHGLS